MASTYASRIGFGNTTTFGQSRAAMTAKIDTKPKVTTGLASTHGLQKIDSGNNLYSLLEQVSNFKFKDYFLDFDRLRKGFVSESRFRSALGMVNNEFTEDDVQTLLGKYRLDSERIDYRTF
jgi:hypothetical protein